jgi:hypothetical protein
MHLCDLCLPDILQTAAALATAGVHVVQRISMHTESSKGHHMDLHALSQKAGDET